MGLGRIAVRDLTGPSGAREERVTRGERGSGGTAAGLADARGAGPRWSRGAGVGRCGAKKRKKVGLGWVGGVGLLDHVLGCGLGCRSGMRWAAGLGERKGETGPAWDLG